MSFAGRWLLSGVVARQENCPMSRQYFSSVLLSWFLVLPALAEEPDKAERDLATEFSKAVAAASDEAKSWNIVQLREAAKAFTDRFQDAEAVALLKKVALDAEASRVGRAEQLAALIGLALLSEKHDSIPFLTSHLGDRDSPLGWHAPLGVSFLPTKDARRIAESVAADSKLHDETRIEHLFLLRAVGDQGTLEKLAKLDPASEPPRVVEVRDRTAWFIKRRFSLEKPEERDRWARLELVVWQMKYDVGTTFRSWKPGLARSAEQLHRIEPDVPVEFLEARLGLERTRSHLDRNIQYEVPLAAALAAIQKNTELLPLLDAWAATDDLGYVSHACAAAAEQLRGRETE
jgi:hypothetical protein